MDSKILAAKHTSHLAIVQWNYMQKICFFLLSKLHREEFCTSSRPRWKYSSGNKDIISIRMFFIVATVIPLKKRTLIPTITEH